MKKKFTPVGAGAMAALIACILMNPVDHALGFSWMDELLCFGAFAAGAVKWLSQKELRRQIPRQMLYFIPFVVYMFMQLLGSVVFRFQPWSAVVIDGITNAKFWLGLYGCYLIGRLVPEEEADWGLLTGAKVASVVIFIAFVIERFRIGFTGGNDTMWGIPYARAIFGQTTYLAAAMVALLAVLLSQWEKKLIPYAAMDMLMLFFTFRSKAFGAMVAFVGLLLFVLVWKQRLKIWQVGVAGIAVVAVAWKKIAYYFLDNQSMSPRYIMLNTSAKILKDYFPMGTGFATFGSHQAVIHYSPLYTKYGFEENYYLNSAKRKFMDDAFWPIVIAQSGAVGLCAFIGMLLLLLWKAWQMFASDSKKYAAGLFCIAYCLIDSIAEPAFNHVATVGLALLMGYWFGTADRKKALEKA